MGIEKDIENHFEENPNPPILQMPISEEKPGFLRDMWNTYYPKKFYEKIWAAGSPITYSLWKMPADTHKDLNYVLDYATEILATVQPEAAIVTGVTDGISHVLYGLKAKKDSGKHVVSGLSKIVTHLEKADPEKAEKFKKKVDEFIGKAAA